MSGRRKASKPIINGFYCGVPMSFLFSNNYSYFESLAVTDMEPFPFLFAARKEYLYKEAVMQAGKAASSISVDSQKVNQAVAFLGRAAESERNKEMAVIQQYKRKILEQLGNNRDMSNKLNSLFNGYDTSNPQQFYEKLIYFFNYTRQNAEDFKERLDVLSQGLREQSQIYSENYIFKNDEDSRAFVQLLSGHLTQKDNATSYRKLIRDATFQVIESKGYVKNNTDLVDFAALAVAIQNDLSHLFQQETYKQRFLGVKNLTPEKIKEITNNYIQGTKDTYTVFREHLYNNDAQLQNIINSYKNSFGIKIKSSKKNKKEQKYSKETFEWLNKLGFSLEQISEMGEITVSCRTKTSSGNIFESVSVALQEGLGGKVPYSAATDIIMLGSIDVTITMHDKVNEQLKKIINEIGTNAKKLSSHVSGEELQASYLRMNTALSEAYAQLNNILKATGSKEDLFIYHESLKNYKAIERGEKIPLHGRELKAFTYLDELYAVQKGGGLTPPSIHYLEFLILNLFDGAVAHRYKDTLEKYFSIFAGLLMFDDAVVMAQNAQRSMMADNSQVKSVHLYNINGVYVPASYVLQSLYQALTEASSMIESGIKVSINDVGSEAKRIEKTSSSPYSKRWDEVSNMVQNETKVNITFLSAFLQLIEQINNTYGV